MTLRMRSALQRTSIHVNRIKKRTIQMHNLGYPCLLASIPFACLICAWVVARCSRGWWRHHINPALVISLLECDEQWLCSQEDLAKIATSSLQALQSSSLSKVHSAFRISMPTVLVRILCCRLDNFHARSSLDSS